MRVTIHQPEYLPWPGFFHKMAKCDAYVILDSVQFTKNNFQNRNRLVDRSGTVFWSTVPVRMAGHTEKKISEMEIDIGHSWSKKAWRRIAHEYHKHPYFNQLAPEVEEIFNASYSLLIDLNLALIEFFRRQLGIEVPIVRSTALNLSGSRSELLLAICKHLNATIYLSGPSGRYYLDTSLFESECIKVDFHEFSPPIYSAPIFHPYLSTLDLLFNHGPSSRCILGI